MITHPDVWFFATNWYRLLDIHAPLDSYRTLMSDDVKLIFPEATVTGFEGYKGWYDKVVSIFFDEQHTLKTADIISQDADSATVHVVVNWHASIWHSPEARSVRLMMDADQTWKVKKDSDGLVIAEYIVNEMIYEPLSCKL